jgi:ubiquinone biosynthesis protein UbiJ
MEPLSAMALRPLESLINHGIAASPEALAVAAELDGMSLDLYVDGTPFALRMVVVDGVVQLSPPDSGQAAGSQTTVSLSGPPITMMRLMAGDPQALIRAGDIRITGPADTADRFHELLHLAKPDIETELGRILGQSAAHQLGSFMRGLGDFSMRAGEKFAQRVSEHLTVEKKSLLTQAELDGFLKGVDTLANDVERAAARVERLRKPGA